MPGRFVRWDEVSGWSTTWTECMRRWRRSSRPAKQKGRTASTKSFSPESMPKLRKLTTNAIWRISSIAWFAAGFRPARRQACAAEETVTQLLNWMKNDDYGFCNDIEKDAIKVLDAEGQATCLSAIFKDWSKGQHAGPERDVPQDHLRIRKRPAVTGDVAQGNLRSLWGMPPPTRLCARGWDSARVTASTWRRWKFPRNTGPRRWSGWKKELS